MRKIKNEELAQLLMEVRFAPPGQRQKQIDRAEQFLDIIEKDREYPFEFVCFKITGFRPKGEVGQRLIKGDELADDLRVFIWKLAGQMAQPAGGQNEEFYTTKQLARKLGVSTKTIDRWRRRGLKFRKLVFADKRKRISFPRAALDKFLSEHPVFAAKAGKFTRMSREQLSSVIERAGQLSRQTQLSRRQIIRQIAKETGKGEETIRCALLKYQKSNPDKATAIRKLKGRLETAEAAEIDRLHRQGAGVTELMSKFDRSKSSIFRVLKQRRIQTLLAKKIEFVHSVEFAGENAQEEITGPREVLEILDKRLMPSKKEGVYGEYLENLKNAPVLNRQQELDLFRRYNYLKYRAAEVREQIRKGQTRSVHLDEVEKCLAEAEAIKELIIRANLRLVVSIAGRHTITGANIADLVSIGNVSLMRAVEKFDYTRGFRFSTYASWAISKDFARRLPGERIRAGRTIGAQAEIGEQQAASQTDIAAVERARSDLIHTIKNNLDSREQFVIINHFGLEGTLVKKNKKTLKQIGDDLGVGKERVRQIELVALQKLRQTLSPEQFDLLIG
ncbi:MAG: sigma-70 family RNA polymerase sigma factor [Sedimentisphaerales bacterium]